MRATCPECGAPLPEGGACRTSFHEMLALEWRIPGGAGAMPHFFAVSSYHLQHPSAFRPEALVGLRTALEDGLAGRADVPALRTGARRAFDGPARVLRDRDVQPGDGTNEPLAGWPTRWPMTVADVCAAPAEAEAYAARVRAWADGVARTLRRADEADRRGRA